MLYHNNFTPYHQQQAQQQHHHHANYSPPHRTNNNYTPASSYYASNTISRFNNNLTKSSHSSSINQYHNNSSIVDNKPYKVLPTIYSTQVQQPPSRPITPPSAPQQYAQQKPPGGGFTYSINIYIAPELLKNHRILLNIVLRPTPQQSVVPAGPQPTVFTSCPLCGSNTSGRILNAPATVAPRAIQY